MKTVFILGAGASAKAGAPLMANFLNVAEKLNRTQKVSSKAAASAFDDVFNAIDELDQTIHSKSYLDLENIETLFSAIEMAQIINKFGKRNQENITKLREAILTVIVKTLELSMPLPVKNGNVYPHSPYKDFVEMIIGLSESWGRYNCSFITFNYDLALDYALHFSNAKFDYHFSETLSDPHYPLLKLHGSLNWRDCKSCGNINFFDIRDIHHFSYLFDKDHVILDLGSKSDSSKSCCGKIMEPPPLLVPPTWNKTGHYKNLIPIWQRAAKDLGEAENIIVIGYSLPATDMFFRYLFALGTESTTRIKRFWVFNPDPDDTVKPRYDDLLGQGIRTKKSYRFEKMTFEIAIKLLKTELKW